jgi:hypothetical protein
VKAHVLAEREGVPSHVTSEQGHPAPVTPDQEAPAPKELGALEEIPIVVAEPSETSLKRDPKRTRERCRQAARRLAAKGKV